MNGETVTLGRQSFWHVQNGRRSNCFPAAVKMASILVFGRCQEGSTCSDDITTGDPDEKSTRKRQPGFCVEHVLRGWIWSVLFVSHSAIVFCLPSLGLVPSDWPLIRSMTQQLHASQRQRQLKDLWPFILLV
jgi:hypothetical protein